MARGLTVTASDCFESLKCLIQNPNNSFSVGILAGHCIEASLKAHLALAGWNEVRLKALGHNLLKCWQAASSVGLDIEDNPPKWLIGIGYSHNRLRYRYPESGSSPWLPHPEDYMDEIVQILEPLKKDLMYLDGKYVEDF